MIEKLVAFRGYFQKLYTVEEIEDNCIEEFLDGSKNFLDGIGLTGIGSRLPQFKQSI